MVLNPSAISGELEKMRPVCGKSGLRGAEGGTIAAGVYGECTGDSEMGRRYPGFGKDADESCFLLLIAMQGGVARRL